MQSSPGGRYSMAVDEQTRRQWSNERWVIDRFVEAVDVGDTDAKATLGQRLLDGIAEDNWVAWRFIDAGPFLSLTNLDPANIGDDNLDCLYQEGAIPDARIDDVLRGRGLNVAELARWREIVVERAFAPGEFDREVRWFIIEVRRAGGRVAYVASFGYEADEYDWYDLPNTSFVAAYATYTETLNTLKSVGFIGPKDYQARSAEVLARTMP